MLYVDIIMQVMISTDIVVKNIDVTHTLKTNIVSLKKNYMQRQL